MVQVLVTLGKAAAPTKTVSVIGFAEPPAGIASLVVQVTVWPEAEHVQSVPVADST